MIFAVILLLLLFRYRHTDRIQVASGASILEESPPSVGKYATQGLLNLKVDLRTKTRVIKSTELPNDQYQITLSSGDKITADIYVPTFGLIPNSSFIPASYLDSKRFVVVDDYLKVKGAGDVWAIGDVNNIDFAQFISCDKQSTALAKNMIKILSKKAPLPYKPAASRKQLY